MLIGKWKGSTVLMGPSPHYGLTFTALTYWFKDNNEGTIDGSAYVNYWTPDTIKWEVILDTLLDYPVIVTKCINTVKPCSQIYRNILTIETINDSSIITQYTDYQLVLKKIR